ncbi:MAG: 30S ribosomal protein S9 [Dehalococcoidia bacterium]|nr:30S ribosomal protein S9 [Dehalococcoidia bacterium]
MVTGQEYFYGTGKRKSAIARVRLMPGTGAIVVNGKSLEEAFPRQSLQTIALTPLRLTSNLGKLNAVIKVEGGGCSGQAGAIRHGISRALLRVDVTLRPVLKKAGLLTRDPRVKERKKYGLKRARKAPQYTKR